MGAAVGGSIGLALLTLLAGLAYWSWKTFGFRARKRRIEDQVYSLVIGAQSNDVYNWAQPLEGDDNLQVSACLHDFPSCTLSLLVHAAGGESQSCYLSPAFNQELG